MWETIFLKQILKERSFLPEEIEKYISQHINNDINVPNFTNFLNLIEKSQSILVLGDYDVDGIVSSGILSFVLKALFKDGKTIKVFIPNRFIHGYGLNQKTLDFILSNYKHEIDTLITVDNGISAIKEIEKLRDEGLKTIIIDHHKIDKLDQKANLVIHPDFFDLNYSYLCASGIVYKIALYLLNWLEKSEVLEKVFTFLAGMATIADVVPLLEDNRKLVKKLFKLLEQKFVPLPIIKLFEKAYKKEILPSGTFHFSHIIIPRLNAPGRIDDPYLAFKFIYKIIKNAYHNVEDKAMEQLVEELEKINKKRQDLQNKLFEKIMQNIKNNEIYKDNIIVPDYIPSEDSELGVIGIVAGKIANIYKKPTFIFVKTNETLKGSVRNPIDNLDITEVISNFKDLVLKFGGHKKAAGIELKPENFEIFRSKISNLPIKNYSYNVDLELSYFFFSKFIKSIDQFTKIMEPFGEKNEKPLIKLTSIFQNQQIEKSNDYNYFVIGSKKVCFKNSKEFLENGKPLYLKFDKILKDEVFFEKLEFNSLEFNSIQKKNASKILLNEIILNEKIYSKGIHFVKVKISSFQALSELLNSYSGAVLAINPITYQKIK
ncbi:MAG: single-stranded-DNA-specific exonuclease RecJ, partial [bacterium]